MGVIRDHQLNTEVRPLIDATEIITELLCDVEFYYKNKGKEVFITPKVKKQISSFLRLKIALSKDKIKKLVQYGKYKEKYEKGW